MIHYLQWQQFAGRPQAVEFISCFTDATRAEPFRSLQGDAHADEKSIRTDLVNLGWNGRAPILVHSFLAHIGYRDSHVYPESKEKDQRKYLQHETDGSCSALRTRGHSVSRDTRDKADGPYGAWQEENCDPTKATANKSNGDDAPAKGQSAAGNEERSHGRSIWPANTLPMGFVHDHSRSHRLLPRPQSEVTETARALSSATGS